MESEQPEVNNLKKKNYMKGCRLFKVDYTLYIGFNPQFNTPKENVICITQVKYNTEDGYALNSHVLLCPLTRKFSPFSITKKYFSHTQKLHEQNNVILGKRRE